MRIGVISEKAIHDRGLLLDPHTGNWLELAKTGLNWQGLVEIGRDWHPIGRNWQQLAEIGSDWLELAGPRPGAAPRLAAGRLLPILRAA
jgi:hypothetical protein